MSQRFFGSLLSIFLIISLFLLGVWTKAFQTLSNDVLFGCMLGVIYGVLLCLYLKETWDPVRLHPVLPKEGALFSKPIFLAITLGAGILIVLASSMLFQMRSVEIYGAAGMVTLIILFGYALFQSFMNRTE